MTGPDLATVSGRHIRRLCRAGTFDGQTAGAARGYLQANLVVLRASVARDFEAFCRANPKPCPILEATAPGRYEPATLAPGSDVRTDLPRYRVFERGGCVDRPMSIGPWWHEDSVAFLIGCSFTFEAALQKAGLPVRHVEEGRNVPMYRTNIACTPAGAFSGPLVVSMRPMRLEQAALASRITAAYPRVHGAPVHVGASDAIGIEDLASPDYGDAVTIRPGEVPVFWACGVTPMEAILRAAPEIAITHEPGHMFVTDQLDQALCDARRSGTAAPP